jgi:protein kinase C substrate 80K-H
LVSYLEDQLASFKSFLVSNGILAESEVASTSESKAVTEARDALNSAKSSLTSDENTLKDHKSDLEKDYGPEDIFRPLKGRCISKDAG